MRKQCFILILFIFCKHLAQGQSGADVIPKIIPPSPNAAAQEKFSTIPVDYSTGVPAISYPMWSWQRGLLQFNIGLKYHAGGHKVDDMPSNVGLGWSMNGIGRVSRTVRGVADDDIVKGFMYTSPLPLVTTYAYDGGQFYHTSPIISVQQNFPTNTAITQYNSPHSSLIWSIVENQMDGEQDIFSFSFGNSSGRFIIDKNRNIIPLVHTKMKIEMVCNPTVPAWVGGAGKIKYFKITDEKGVVYKFEFEESSTSETWTNPPPFPPIPVQGYTSGWLLTKIIDPSTQDSIVITHGNTGGSGGQYETGFSESQSIPLTSSGGFGSPGGSMSYNMVGVNDLAPSSVLFPDGSVAEFEYDFNRLDLLNSKALTKVTIKNYQNTVVKKFQLSYSYFNSGTSAPAYGVSGNDYSKRLRLDKIEEVSNDNALLKPTIFTYNPVLLNARGSKNIDFWGYNVNPARNNLEYVPKMPLAGTDLQAYGSFLPGGDRSPDSVYAKAAVLEKIQYPTGGFVSFEYESNKAFSSINYYDNVLVTNTPEWSQYTFNQTQSLVAPNRVNEDIKFLFKAEPDPQGIPQDNDPPTCFEEGQNLMIVRYEISSTDGTFFTFRQFTYIQLINVGVEETLQLPLNKTYQVKCIYNPNANCAFLYPFKAKITGSYYISQQDKLAGGLRIKRITANDGSGIVSTKEYDYNNPDGHSSAVFTSTTNIPNFFYYRTSVDISTPLNITYAHNINRSSNPTNSLNFNGTPLVYARVIERESDGSSTERLYDPLVTASNGGDPQEYPYLPIQDFPNLSGLLTKETIKDKNGTVKTEKIISYKKVMNTLLNDINNRNIKTGTIASAAQPNYDAKYYVADMYYMYTSRVEVSSEENKMYEGSQTMTKTIANTYDPNNYFLRTAITTNSKNELRKEQYSYATDESGPAYSAMMAKNMLNYVTLKWYGTPGQQGQALHQVKTVYQLYQGNTLPVAGMVLSNTYANGYEIDIAFNDYDDKGNLLQYTAKDGVVTSIVWGYNKQYPVAKIVGKSYNDAISQSGLNLAIVNAPASDAAMRTELNKLRNLAGGCFVTTLTHKPLVGVTSETDADGNTVYYEYDNFNRLALIRNKDNKILKKFCYNYVGQPVDCGNGALPAWQMISSTCQLNAQGQMTGNRLIVEKDMNPSSSTYNQTRNIVLTNDPACGCSGPDKKMINGVCETGIIICVRNIRLPGGLWQHEYYYEWSDGSTSPTYIAPGLCFF